MVSEEGGGKYSVTNLDTTQNFQSKYHLQPTSSSERQGEDCDDNEAFGNEDNTEGIEIKQEMFDHHFMASPSIAGVSDTDNINASDFDRNIVPEILQKVKEIHDLLKHDPNAERGYILQQSLHAFNCYKRIGNNY